MRRRHLGEEHSRQGDEQVEEQRESWWGWRRVDRRQGIGHGDQEVYRGGAQGLGAAIGGLDVKFDGMPVRGCKQGSDDLMF